MEHDHQGHADEGHRADPWHGSTPAALTGHDGPAHRLALGEGRRTTSGSRPGFLRHVRVAPFAFMELQDVQELFNFFERWVSAYQVAVSGTVSFDEDH